MRLIQFGVLTSFTLFAGSAAAQQSASVACSISPARAHRTATMLLVGKYALTLETTSGLNAGNSATGSLWLARTSPSDSPPATGRRPDRKSVGAGKRGELGGRR